MLVDGLTSTTSATTNTNIPQEHSPVVNVPTSTQQNSSLPTRHST